LKLLNNHWDYFMIARKICMLLASVFMFTTAPSIYAGNFYFGAKVGQMVIDNIGVNDPTNIGLTLGYEIGTVVADVGVEGEYTRSAKSGSYEDHDVDVETMGLYVAARSAGPIYAKGRLGYVNTNVDGRTGIEDSGVSFGLGFGFSVGIAQFEFEYTKINADINFFSAAVLF
jgi:outer membrane immunogenic protein